MGSLTWSKIVIIFLPLIFSLYITGHYILTTGTQKKALNKLMKNSTKSYVEKTITTTVQQQKTEKQGFKERENAKLELLGLNYKVESLMAVSAVLFVITAIVSMFLFKAGPFLMIYLGAIAGYSVFVYINSILEKRKKELTTEFLEKMRDIASYLSVGHSLSTAIQEAGESGNISPVMKRELGIVKSEIFTGTRYAKAFMNMYDRLGIDEIRLYAETLSTFEESGGNLINIMKVNDKFATNKIEIKNEQNIFVEGQKSSQKVIVGCPLLMVVILFIVNPSFFGDFYSTLLGQVVAIVCITVLLVGVKLSNDLAKM